MHVRTPSLTYPGSRIRFLQHSLVKHQLYNLHCRKWLVPNFRKIPSPSPFLCKSADSHGNVNMHHDKSRLPAYVRGCILWKIHAKM